MGGEDRSTVNRQTLAVDERIRAELRIRAQTGWTGCEAEVTSAECNEDELQGLGPDFTVDGRGGHAASDERDQTDPPAARDVQIAALSNARQETNNGLEFEAGEGACQH